MAMDLVCYVERTASALTNRQLSLLLGLEVPDGVVVLWVLQQLFGLHRAVSHDSYARHRMDCQLSSRMARLSLGQQAFAAAVTGQAGLKENVGEVVLVAWRPSSPLHQQFIVRRVCHNGAQTLAQSRIPVSTWVGAKSGQP